MSKIIRTARVGSSAVTIGKPPRTLSVEDEEHLDPPAVDLAVLIQARVAESKQELDAEWEKRLSRELGQVREAAEEKLAQAEAQSREQHEKIAKERYDEGYKAGSDDNIAEVTRAVSRLDALHESLKQEHSQVLLEAENLVVDLASALAQRVTKFAQKRTTRCLRRLSGRRWSI